MKTCKHCGETKELDQFNYSRNAKDRLHPWCKTCVKGLVVAHRWKKKNARNPAYTDATNVTTLLEETRKQAANQRVAFKLTEADISIPTICPALGIPLIFGGDKDFSPCLLRIDPRRGWTPENTAVVSYKAIRVKSNHTMRDLVWVGEFLKNAYLERFSALDDDFS